MYCISHAINCKRRSCREITYSNSFLSQDNFYDDKSRPSFVCVFSLKNPSYPEFLCRAHCGVMCVDVHPRHPHMLAAGMSDGSVAVYNLQGGGGAGAIEPAYVSTARNGKHQVTEKSNILEQ